jgi:hypothetical protein
VWINGRREPLTDFPSATPNPTMTVRTASPDPIETRALLSESPPPSYHAVDDSDADSDVSNPPLLNQVSRSDLIWVLAGLWSAVFLGALDGQFMYYSSTTRVNYFPQEPSSQRC